MGGKNFCAFSGNSVQAESVCENSVHCNSSQLLMIIACIMLARHKRNWKEGREGKKADQHHEGGRERSREEGLMCDSVLTPLLTVSYCSMQ